MTDITLERYIGYKIVIPGRDRLYFLAPGDPSPDV
jgi:hypothetical protein